MRCRQILRRIESAPKLVGCVSAAAVVAAVNLLTDANLCL